MQRGGFLQFEPSRKCWNQVYEYPTAAFRQFLKVSGGIMGKVIAITFAFMAFAFYELSGGSEFVAIEDEKRAVAVDLQKEETRVLAQAKAERLNATSEIV